MRFRVDRALDGLLVTAAVGLTGRLVQAWQARLAYPYDLEWMEGGMLAHAWRVQQGLPIYDAPSAEWVPYVYPPLYSWVLAGVGSLVGLDYAAGRGLSLAATAAAALAAGWMAARGRGARSDAIAGAVAAVTFLGTWRASGAFFDMVRPDALFVALTGWALALPVLAGAGIGAPIASGLLLTAAFAAKHNAAAFGLPLLGAWAARGGRREAGAFLGASLLPALAFVGAMQWSTDGWFLTYLLEVPASHPQLLHRVVPGMQRELGAHLPFALAGIAAALVGASAALRGAPSWVAFRTIGLGLIAAAGAHWLPNPDVPNVTGPMVGLGAGALWVALLWGGHFGVDALVRAGRQQSAPGGWRALYLGGVAATALALAAVMRAHNGGFVNVYMQLHWTIAVAFGLAVAHLRAHGGPALRWAGALGLLQIGWSAWKTAPEEVTPTAADREAGDTFVALLRDAPPGPIFSPYAAWLPVQAGRAPSLHLMGLWDLEYDDGPLLEEARAVKADIRRARFSLIVDGTRGYGRGIEQTYRKDKTITLPEGVFLPQTGWDVRPSALWRPKGPEAP
jgi:hypothetical protein